MFLLKKKTTVRTYEETEFFGQVETLKKKKNYWFFRERKDWKDKSSERLRDYLFFIYSFYSRFILSKFWKN